MNDRIPVWPFHTNQFLKAYKAPPGLKRDEFTHLSLIGGTYVVPAEKERDLFQMMQTDLEEGVHTFLVELRTPVFPLLFDFDFHLPVSEPPLLVQAFADDVLRDVVRVVRQNYPMLDTHTGRAIVCTAPPKDVMREVPNRTERMSLRKYGFHVLFPEVFVDKIDALGVREGILQTVSKKLGERYVSFMDSGEKITLDTWENVIDASVLKENGLRMLGAYKADKCPMQHTAEKCNMCQGAKKLNAKRPYSVVMVMDGDGSYENELAMVERDFLSAVDHYAAALRVLSVRRTGVDKLPVVFLPGTQIACGKRKRLLVESGMKPMDSMLLPGTTVHRNSVWTTFTDLSAPSVQLFVGFIQRSFPAELWQQWQGIRSLSVSVSGRFARLRCFPNQNFCPRVNRLHHSNRLYFEIFRLTDKYMMKTFCFSQACRADAEWFNAHAFKDFTSVQNVDDEMRRLLLPTTVDPAAQPISAERQRCGRCRKFVDPNTNSVATNVCRCEIPKI